MTTPAAAVETPANVKSAGQDDKAGAPAAPAEIPAIKPKDEGPSPALAAARAAKAATDAALVAEEAKGTPATKPEAEKAKEGEAPKPVETAPNPDPNWQANYTTFEDPSAQAAVDLLKEAKVSPVEANAYFAEAIKTGDVSKVDWAGLELKIGKTQTQLIKNGVETYYNNTYKVQQQTVSDVHAAFGGEGGWKTVRDWAHTAEKADPKVKTKVDAIRKMIDQGGDAALIGAQTLKSMYDADPSTKGLGTSKVLQGDSVPAAVEGGPLNKADYFTQIKAAQAKGDEALVASLRTRRQAGIKAGV